MNQPQSHNLISVTDNTTAASKKEENIKHLCTCICKSSLLSLQTSNRGLIDYFTRKRATSEQANNMLHFHKTGTESFHQFISHYRKSGNFRCKNIFGYRRISENKKHENFYTTKI